MTAYTDWGSPTAPRSRRSVTCLRTGQVLGAAAAAAVAAVPGAVFGYIAGCFYLLVLHYVFRVVVTSTNDEKTSPLFGGFYIVMFGATALIAGSAAVGTWQWIGRSAERRRRAE